MGIINTILTTADVVIGVYGQTYDVYLNWIGKIISFLIGSVGSVGVGIILFSLVLKLVVLPFDIYQRVAMRKQNIKMKENQARMEKLQKQYANNKELYNQKVMEMYKENGISMFSSCLPMILSLVIFIVAINAFNAYSQYSNIQNYNTMVQAYNAEIYSYCPDLTSETVSDDGNLILVRDETGEDKYIYYTLPMPTGEDKDYTKDDYAYIREMDNKEKSFKIDAQKALSNAEIDAFVKATTTEEITTEMALALYFKDKAQTAVVASYENEVLARTQFIWIKNIWVTDAMYKHPVLEYSDFEAEITREKFNVDGNQVSLNEVNQKYTTVYTPETYNEITAKLTTQKSQANGYFILILLSIGTILLQQWVSNKSQKEQQKYATVDGQGEQQQKMTMIIMTGMFAVFSFMYSSSFSIYMITSNIFSLISTVIINKVVDSAALKKEREQLQAKNNQRLPRTSENNDKKNKK